MEGLSAQLPGWASTGPWWEWGLREPEPEPEPDPEPEREWADAERVLTVGDGDLSYSLNLLRTERRARREGGRRLVLVASTLDSRVELLRRYGPQVAATMAELDGGEDVRGELAGTGPVLSRFVPGVDATRLAATLGAGERGVVERGDATRRRYRNRRGVHFLDWLLTLGPAAEASCFDRIDWLFPHTGQQKIQTQRLLLRDFFVSAASHLRPRGTIRVALAQGQGGTPMESVQRKPADSWQVVEAAAYGGLVLCAVAPFVDPGGCYRPTGRRNTSSAFNTRSSLMHHFALPQRRAPAVSLYPPTYAHDVSFWWPAEGGNSFGGSSLSAWLRRVVCDVAGEDRVVRVEQVERYVPPASAEGERSRVGLTFRVVYQDPAEALSRAAAAALQAEVRLQLGLMGVELR